jgi:hypothetical protein
VSEHVVIDHHRDFDAGVYRLVTGIPIIEARPLLDERGLALLDDDDQQLTEQVIVGYDEILDVVFDAGDEQWSRLDAAAVAAKQREIVNDALIERATRADAAPETATLPGIGDALAR